jgi:hypothetical protein
VCKGSERSSENKILGHIFFHLCEKWGAACKSIAIGVEISRKYVIFANDTTDNQK